MKKRKIILDCDPGHDDAVAIMLAGSAKNIELLGITVTCGNQTLPKTLKNALNLVQFLNLNVPVSPGVEEPIVREIRVAPEIHGETGLDGFEFPELTIKPDSRHAIDFIIETLMKSTEKITMVTTGPMTNLALALRKQPKIKEHIEEIVFMGGSYTYGNVTPAAEFNILFDPEAAHIIFTSGLPIVMLGLDVTRKVQVLPEIITRMDKIQNRVSDLFTKLMITFNLNQKRVFDLDGGPLHDPLTIAYLIDSTVVQLTPMNCTIDISQGPSSGRTNCDVAGYSNAVKNTLVATSIDVDKYWNIIEEAIRSYQ